MKKWNILSEYKEGDIVNQLILNRGVTDVETFLNPPAINEAFKSFSTEFKESLKNGAQLVHKFIAENKAIIIHGDYDADGICSTAILYNILKTEFGYDKVFSFIPNRFEHGYGVSKKSVDTVLEQVTAAGVNIDEVLFITVDSGITANVEVDYIKSLGHKVIITDHHQPPEPLPTADVIIWSDKLVGAGIAWVFGRALGSKDVKSIALAALATITDLQPVLDFNRSLVKRGLEVINSDPPIGLAKLLDVSARRSGEVTTYDLGWVIGPRLNATGRLIDASESLKLLVEKNAEKVAEIAHKLNDVNVTRQDKTLEMYAFASGVDPDNLPKIIISASENYHEGISGLVAAKLVQKFFRPSIVISLNDGYGKGSVRSVRGVNIISLLRNFENLFDSLGGHPMAAGFTIKKENIPVLEEKLLALAQTEISDDLLCESLNVDIKIPINLIDMELLNSIDKLKPFGLGNEEPVFMSDNVGLMDITLMGKEKQHVSLKLYKQNKYYKAILFSGAELVKDLAMGDKLDVVYTIKRNNYNGNESIDLMLKDFKRSV